MTSSSRRTPAEIARDDLKAQMEKVEQAEEQAAKRAEMIESARERIRGALRRADYLVQNPDLPPEMADAFAVWRKEHDVPEEADEPTPGEEVAWRAGAREVLSAVIDRLSESQNVPGQTVAEEVAEEFGIDFPVEAEIVEEEPGA